MSTDPSLALQAALVAAIKAIPTEAGNNVFDEPPSSDPFPRVTVGDGQTVGVYAGCYDGSEVFLTIDVWTRTTGYPVTKSIASKIRAALHDAPLALVGHTLELIEFRDTVYSREPDGITRRGRITVRALTQPNP